MIDCQIRPSAAHSMLAELGIPLDLVVLTCPRRVREQRLLDRGWTRSPFETIANWDGILVADARRRGNLVIDTSTSSPEDVCRVVLRYLSTWEDRPVEPVTRGRTR